MALFGFFGVGALLAILSVFAFLAFIAASSIIASAAGVSITYLGEVNSILVGVVYVEDLFIGEVLAVSGEFLPELLAGDVALLPLPSRVLARFGYAYAFFSLSSRQWC